MDVGSSSLPILNWHICSNLISWIFNDVKGIHMSSPKHYIVSFEKDCLEVVFRISMKFCPHFCFYKFGL